MDQKPYVPIAILVTVVALASLFVPRFATPLNIGNVLVQSVPLMFVATGQTLVLLSGGMDLSVGEVVTLCTIIASSIMQPGPAGIALGVAACLLASSLVGAANGIGSSRLGLPPFLVTLGMMFALQGVNLFLRPTPGGSIPRAFRQIAQLQIGVVPVAALVTLLIVGAVAVHVRRSRFGLRLFAVGGDERRAHLAGISPHGVKISAYVACALLAALAGLFLAARTGSGDRFIGSSYGFDSITAAVMGGTSLSGGKGNLWGSVASALLLGVISNLLNLLHVVAYWQWIVKGMLLIVAVTMYTLGEVRGHGRPRSIPTD